MLKVRTYTAPSTIHGTGLFAAELIPQGTVVWQWDPAVDRSTAQPPQGHDADWAWHEADGRWYIPGDDARYLNHSFTPNLVVARTHNDVDVAACDIAPHEEITTNYALFDVDWPTYAANYPQVSSSRDAVSDRLQRRLLLRFARWWENHPQPRPINAHAAVAAYLATEAERLQTLNLTELLAELPPDPTKCAWCGMRAVAIPGQMCAPCTAQDRLDTATINRLLGAGHPYHCAARQTWGDGECECPVDRPHDPRVPGGL